MAERRVIIGKGFEYIPAVKAGSGALMLEKGNTATVRFDKGKKKLELKKETGKRQTNTEISLASIPFC